VVGVGLRHRDRRGRLVGEIVEAFVGVPDRDERSERSSPQRERRDGGAGQALLDRGAERGKSLAGISVPTASGTGSVSLMGDTPTGKLVRAIVPGVVLAIGLFMVLGQVKDAPHAEADGALSQDEEAALYRHYGLAYSEAGSDSGLPAGQTGDRSTAGRDVSGSETDDAMTRSEEEVRIGTTQRESGRVRLRKYVVTEQVTKTVPVSHEEVRVEREPITDANRGDALSGADLSEEEHEVVLHAEEPVVEKGVVPKERVRLDTDTVTEDVQVDEQTRKERIDVVDGEGEPAEGRDGVRGSDDGV
jgi:uncharacterized protein (TIGR02271 family)